MLVTSGSLTIIADARLNRLICVGNTSDLKLVEQYLAVIDKDTSLTSIEIHGVSHVLELKHAKATEIADVIRDTYGDRVAMNTEQKKALQTQRTNDKDRGANGPENKIQTSRNQEPQMSIAVHEVSNSIIVTAPDTLFQEIKQLIEKLDQQSEQAVEVIYYPSAEGIGMLREALQLKGSPIKPRATTATPTKPK
jgi:type II secretory pathway component GspD/PulD (secretin)